MFFSVFGLVEASHERHSYRPGGAMQQTLLTSLLVSGSSVVTVESLILELWGTTPPSKVENALQAQISRLRRNLARIEPGRTASRVVTSVSGYRLGIEPLGCDAHLFVHTVDKVRSRLEAGTPGRDPQDDIRELRQAIGHWRGPIFGGLAGGPLCQTAAVGYLESRNTALALLYELEICSGGFARVLPELTTLHLQYPNHEQFCTLLMRALYRTGRQIDALNVYRKFRHNLVDNLGIEPSPALQRIERAILTHDPLLQANRPAAVLV